MDDFDPVAIIEGDVLEGDLAFELLVSLFLRVEDIAIFLDDLGLESLTIAGLASSNCPTFRRRLARP
jgi:hypothetical protein